MLETAQKRKVPVTCKYDLLLSNFCISAFLGSILLRIILGPGATFCLHFALKPCIWGKGLDTVSDLGWRGHDSAGPSDLPSETSGQRSPAPAPPLGLLKIWLPYKQGFPIQNQVFGSEPTINCFLKLAHLWNACPCTTTLGRKLQNFKTILGIQIRNQSKSDLDHEKIPKSETMITNSVASYKGIHFPQMHTYNTGTVHYSNLQKIKAAGRWSRIVCTIITPALKTALDSSY